MCTRAGVIPGLKVLGRGTTFCEGSCGREHTQEKKQLRLVVPLHKFHITEGDAESTEVMPFTEMRYFSGLGTVIVTCCPRGRALVKVLDGA